MPELSAFEQAFDEMSLNEVICRLPGKLAIGSLKRRIKDLDGVKSLLEAQDAGGAVLTKELKEYVNFIIRHYEVDKVLDFFKPETHRVVFGWLDSENKKKFYDQGKDKLSVEFVFNMTSDYDYETLNYLLNRVCQSTPLEVSKITSILRKADCGIFDRLCDSVLSDERPEVRASVLSVFGSNFARVSNHQKMIALKSFAKLPSLEGSHNIQILDFKLFEELKPLERIMALDKYLNYFPEYKHGQVFNPAPTEEEFKNQLFAGCFDFPDLVDGIIEKYEKITKLDPPKEDKE